MASPRVHPIIKENINSANQSSRQTITTNTRNPEYVAVDIDNDDFEILPAQNYDSRNVEPILIPDESAYQSYKAEDTMPIIWLDPNANGDRDNIVLQTLLKEVTKSLVVVVNDEECEEYIRQLPTGEQVILIVAGSIGAVIIPRVHDSKQLNVIYVYAFQKQYYKEKFQKYDKVEEIIVERKELIDKLREKQDIYRTPMKDELSVNVYNIKEGRKTGNQSDANERFMWMYLFIDILLHISPSWTELMIDNEKQELTEKLKEIYAGDQKRIEQIDKFKEDYTPDKAIYWYTCESPLYSQLNRALREENLELLIPFRFYIVDIYNQLLHEYKKSHDQTSSENKVYRSQLLSSSAILRLKKSINGYLSMNSFFSTTSDAQIALNFVQNARNNLVKGLQCVFLVIEIDPSLQTLPYANIKELSVYREEQEVLFSPGTIFKIQKIYCHKENDLCTIELRLCGEDESELESVFSYWKQSIESQTNLASFGWLMLKTGQLDQVKKFYLSLIDILDPNNLLIKDCFQVLGNVYLKVGEFENAIAYHEQAVAASERVDKDDKWLAKGYSCLADAYKSNGELEKALRYYKRGFKKFKRFCDALHQDAVTCLNNIGEIYQNQGDYEKAAKFFKAALELDADIQQRCQNYQQNRNSPPDIRPNDPYNQIKVLENLSLIHEKEDKTDDALKCLERALKVSQKHFETNDPEIGLLHERIGDIHLGSRQFIKALSSYHRAAEIYYYACTQLDSRNIEIQKVIKCCNFELKRIRRNRITQQDSNYASSNINQSTSAVTSNEPFHSHSQAQPRTRSSDVRGNQFEQVKIDRHNAPGKVNTEYNVSRNPTTNSVLSSRTKEGAVENNKGSNERPSRSQLR